MSFAEKIKQLRNEKDWSQEALSRQINIDNRQISRYENGKFLPSADVLIRIAEVLNVSIDYLLFDVPRKPLHFKEDEIVNKLSQIEKLSEEDRQCILHIIDSIMAKNKLKELASNIK